MKISFQSENGCCPKFTYKDTKFYIDYIKSDLTDKLYFLFMKNLKTKVKTFTTLGDVLVFLKSQKASFSNSYGSFDAYENHDYYFRIEGKTVTQMEKAKSVGYGYTTRKECENAANIFIQTFINEHEPTQLPRQLDIYDILKKEY